MTSNYRDHTDLLSKNPDDNEYRGAHRAKTDPVQPFRQVAHVLTLPHREVYEREGDGLLRQLQALVEDVEATRDARGAVGDITVEIRTVLTTTPQTLNG